MVIFITQTRDLYIIKKQIKYQTLKGNPMHKASRVHTGFTDGSHFNEYDKTTYIS